MKALQTNISRRGHVKPGSWVSGKVFPVPKITQLGRLFFGHRYICTLHGSEPA
jgi:hypothetical protein